MLTQNGINFLGFALYRCTTFFVDMDGNEQSNSDSNSKNFMTNSSNRRFYVGTGNTEPTINDYSMDILNNDLTQLSMVSYPNNSSGYFPSGTGTDKNLSCIMSFTATYKNNTENPITIKEIGAGVYLSSSYDILLAREVLETPVTIEPNKTYSFSITIS